MKKNMLIAALVVLNIVTAAWYFKNRPVETPPVEKASDTKAYYYFPAVTLAEHERITAAELQFETAIVKSLRNIPPGWYFSINVDTPPSPVVSGSILVGAAAVGSAAELPFFELEGYGAGAQAAPLRAFYTVAKYPDGVEKARKVTVEIKK
ncbi:MAG: hypothetical protein JW832_01495 [Deltaproteobacteria bacterium]|nr:hypothetical protein [Deltaproteobacteria bacterium]